MQVAAEVCSQLSLPLSILAVCREPEQGEKILDRAVPPEWKSRPSVLKNTVIAGVVAIILGVCLAFLLESITHVRRRIAEVVSA
jgi:capsular polysaccharide biosynthesis protein